MTEKQKVQTQAILVLLYTLFVCIYAIFFGSYDDIGFIFMSAK